jgi:mono/diheme cytochrome c family protein
MVLAALMLLGCDDMAEQSRPKPYSLRTATRVPPDGIVPREAIDTAAPPLSLSLLERGRERFNIYCSPCHARVGDGNGMIVQRGFPHPPSFHSDRLRAAPTQHIYDVITNGYGAMYSYAARVPPPDRWAIAAYIRALQASQHAHIDDAPAAREHLE